MPTPVVECKQSKMTTTDRPRVFLDIDIAGKSAGRMVVELFSDKTPKTCENFRQLCTGEHKNLSYSGTPFHRIIDEFMIQGGDIANGDGTGIISIYGKEFEDENLDWRDMDAAMLVCSANRGKDTNGSQFFITLDSSPHLNGRHTIFGHVVSGKDVVTHMAKVDVDKDDKPSELVSIARCGELQKRAKAQPVKENVVKDASSRGRARDEDRHETYKPSTRDTQQLPRKRRPSDSVRDEGLRGRPRKRSKQRADSSAIDEASMSDPSTSPVKIHKRGRSPSPGPGEQHGSDSANETRRRRSLPNQYYKDRDQERRSHRGSQHDQRDGDRYGDRYRYDHYDNGNRFGERDGRYDRDRGRPHDHGQRKYGYDRSSRLDSDTIDDSGGAVKFKGRGAMKYREPGRL